MAPFSGLRSYADSGFVWCQHFLRLSIILGRMDKSIELRPGRHCVFTKHVHLVFVTKVRRGVFTKRNPGGRICGGIFASVCHAFEATLVDGEDDHVHLLVHYEPKVSVSALVAVNLRIQAETG